MTVILKEKLQLPIRLRRNRKSPQIRSIIEETHLLRSDLVVPLFLIEGKNQKEPIDSLPSIQRYSIDLAIQEARRLSEEGIQALALFPVLDPSLKDPTGSEATNPNGLFPRAIAAIKEEVPSLCLFADIALDPFTSHGHDGILNDKGEVDNDPTVFALGEMALLQANAGIDFIAPSDMMDGRIGYLRSLLDQEGFTQTGILSYAAKYASCFYGPFRQAVKSSFQGSKASYQLNPANRREALLEALLDEEEGADILMVKPAGPYLDILYALRERTERPLAAYHVSGEYAMAMAAHEKGWINGPKVLYESLLSIKRSGADLIFTYAADQILPLM